MTCLGLYCGRLLLGNGTLSECGACPSGSRVNASSGICQECTNILSDYDWFYLLFMALLPLLSNYFFIDVTSKNRFECDHCKNVTLHISATIEAAISLVITILSFQPIGTFTIKSCESTRLSDWYTILYNPSPDFINTIHCTQQAVYPLYSMVFLMYLLSLKIRTSCVRWDNSFIDGKRRFCTCSLYSALFFHPAIACIHAVFAGVIYYSYPYIIVVGSVITNAIHFASYRNQTPVGLLKSLTTKPRNMVILMAHWLVHAFGIISLLSSNIKTNQLAYLCLIPTPCLVYVISVYFTDPDVVWDKENYTNNDSSNFAVGPDSMNAAGSGVAATSTAAVNGSFREMGDQKANNSSKEIDEAIYEEVVDVAEAVPLKE
ncbi:hypothetical protein HELRODRAFT_85220 [Helobdella robusta]|uniref:JNK1/MAPK8-associated membrane protein n=1 Tax=Helobdella robusta TaxID=6412 RepID=T1G5U4_HELRO|nr:hypothetical protein HELRODRAFT_85220 [Helobdella robusta]ESN97664.1 hypothetical protein HELRODRAFT_85220 [Helobdella robusta]